MNKYPVFTSKVKEYCTFLLCNVNTVQYLSSGLFSYIYLAHLLNFYKLKAIEYHTDVNYELIHFLLKRDFTFIYSLK